MKTLRETVFRGNNKELVVPVMMQWRYDGQPWWATAGQWRTTTARLAPTTSTGMDGSGKAYPYSNKSNEMIYFQAANGLRNWSKPLPNSMQQPLLGFLLLRHYPHHVEAMRRMRPITIAYI